MKKIMGFLSKDVFPTFLACIIAFEILDRWEITGGKRIIFYACWLVGLVILNVAVDKISDKIARNKLHKEMDEKND